MHTAPHCTRPCACFCPFALLRKVRRNLSPEKPTCRIVKGRTPESPITKTAALLLQLFLAAHPQPACGGRRAPWPCVWFEHRLACLLTAPLLLRYGQKNPPPPTHEGKRKTLPALHFAKSCREAPRCVGSTWKPRERDSAEMVPLPTVQSG